MDDNFYIKTLTHLVLEDLYVKGVLTINDIYIIGSILINDGTQALPAYSFIDDMTTGMYLEGLNQLGFSSGGTERLEINNTSVETFVPIYNTNGSALLPSYTFSTNTDTGMYLSAPDTIGFTCGGNLIISIGPTGIQYSFRFLEGDGSAGAPSYSFINNTNLGMYRVGADTLGFSALGVLRSSISPTAITNTIPIHAPNGSVGTPSFSFSSSQTTGIYSSIADNIQFSTNGVLRTTISPTSVTHTLPILETDGSAGNPSYSFSASSTTGVYSAGIDTIGWSTAGVERQVMSTTLNTINLPTTINATAITTRALQVICNGNQAQIGSFRRLGDETTASGLSYMSFTEINDGEHARFGTRVIAGGNPSFFFSVYHTPTATIYRRLVLGQDGSGIGLPTADMTYTPSITWQLVDDGLGLDRLSSTSFSCKVSGVSKLTISSTDLTSSVPIYNTSGSVTAPSYTFSADTNTGMYLKGASIPAITAGGVDRIMTTAPLTLVNNTVTTILSLTEASNTMIGGLLRYTTEVFDTSDVQVETGEVVVSGYNRAGVFSNTATKVNNQQNVSAGTLTITWTITGANPALLQVNANSSLTPTTGYPRITYTYNNNTQQVVTMA